MSKNLPSRPNLDHLRDQAKKLLADYRRGDAEAVKRIEAALPERQGAIALNDAQWAIAREYGFASWPKLVAAVDELRAKNGITPDVEANYVGAVLWGRQERVQRLLDLYPGLTKSSAAGRLVSGEADGIGQLDPNALFGPQNLPPLFYVVYSRMHTMFPDRYEAQAKCAKALLDRGARVDEDSLLSDGVSRMSALYGASAHSGHLGVTRLLLEHGADPNDGESVYHSAEQGRIEILEALGEHGARFGGDDQPLGFMVYYRDFDDGAERMLRGAKWLLEHGANPNIRRTEMQETPLINACRYRRADLIEMLLDHGADPSLRDKDGNTAYQMALACGNSAALRILESRGYAEAASAESLFLAACASNDADGIRRMLAADPGLASRLQVKALDLMRRFAETNQHAACKDSSQPDSRQMAPTKSVCCISPPFTGVSMRSSC